MLLNLSNKIILLVLALGLVSLVLFFSKNNTVLALEVQPKTNFNIDASLNTQKELLNLPNVIYVAPVFMPSELNIQDSEWYEGLYYYMAARLGQGDFLAHYILSKDGTVFQGNSKGDEQRLAFAGISEKPILIIYLASTGQTDFSFQAKESLNQLLLNIANANSINPSKIFLKSLSINLKQNEPVTLKTDTYGGLWEVSTKEIIRDIATSYKPITKNYTLQVVKVDIPKNNFNFGDKIIAAISIKNTSDKILYQGTDYEPIIAKTSNQASKFYINGTWLSQTQASIFLENTFLKPEETKIYNVNLGAPLYFGELKETFQLINPLGNAYANTVFDMSINVNHPSQRVAEITNTETGQLNVRDGPWASSKVFTRVSPGQRFIVLEITETGYTKIDIGNGKVGWVVSKYTKLV